MEYYEQLYATNIEDRDKFLERYKVLKLTQEEQDNLNRPNINQDIKLVILKIWENPKQAADSVQSLSKSQWHFSQKQNNPKILYGATRHPKWPR